ncbi:MAG: hypothetical protein GY811_06955 [Myxococcales bacterium]|nr:hypothetical protein [Myxococcales bacterium]
MIQPIQLLALAALCSCTVPLSTSSPQSPRTAGEGNVRVRGHVDYPAVDTLATVTTSPDPRSPSSYPSLPGAAFDAQLGYGVDSTLDIEAGLGGEVAVIIPVPHAVWLGARRAWPLSTTTTLGVAGRLGYAGFWAARREQPREDSTVSMFTGSLAVSVERTLPHEFRVLAAVAAMPAWVRPRLKNSVDDVDDFLASAYTATLALTRRDIGPFVSGGLIDGSDSRGFGLFGVFGLAKTY